MSRVLADPSEWRIGTNEFSVASEAEWAREHHPLVHELIWKLEGALTVETEAGFFAVPSTLGLWIPAGVDHRVVASANTTFRCTFVVAAIEFGTGAVAAVAMPPIVRGLLDLIESPTTLGRTGRVHAEELVLELLETVDLATFDLPVPIEARTRAVASAILAAPADDRRIEDWAHAVGSSARNLSRLFVAETGLSFSAWRVRARMRRAVELLAADLPVSAVAKRVGYATTSAFVHAFRRELRMTPGEFASSRIGGSTHRRPASTDS